MSSDIITDTTDNRFQDEVLHSELPVLVDFWATWCGPCRALAPHVEAVAHELAGKLKVVKIDIDSNPQTMATYNVHSVPSLLVFKGGAVVDRLIGNPGSKKKISELVARHVL